MKKEIKAQEGLDHPNILPVLAHGDDFEWYATRRAECSLDALGPFSQGEWMQLRAGLLGVVSALSYAHAKGLVHRDLSSGNVLVFAHGWAVSDWGFVYVPPRGGLRMTQPLERFGTPEFMAPEMAIDPANVGPPADIFSFGRLAAWGTGLRRGESFDDDDAAVRWWRLLIDGTTRYEPGARWTNRDVETHLRSQPVCDPNPSNSVLRAPAAQACSRNQSRTLSRRRTTSSSASGLQCAMGARRVFRFAVTRSTALRLVKVCSNTSQL
jgi:serine/threonine protein kinase